MSKYFMDCEFLEGTQTKRLFGFPIGQGWKILDKPYKQTKPTIDLISIGMVSEDNREYYAISKDFNLKEAWNRWQQRTGEGDRNNIEPRLYWLRQNVLKPIYKELASFHIKDYPLPHIHFGNTISAWNKKLKFCYEDLKWLISKYGKTNKQIAEEIKSFTRKVKVENETLVQDKPQFYAYYADYDWVAFCWLFGKMMELPNGFPMYCIDLKQELDRIQQFHVDRYKAGDLKTFASYPKQTNEHNALADAKWNKQLHEFLNQL